MRILFYPIIIGLLIFYQCSNEKNVGKYNVYTPDLKTIEDSQKIEPKIYHGSNKRYADLLHTKLDVRFNWEKQFLLGKAWLTLKPYYYPIDSLVLDAKGFDLHKIAIKKNNQWQDIPYRYVDSLKIHLYLDKSYTRHDTFMIYIDYTAKPELRKTEGSEAIQSDKGLFFINPLGTDSLKPQQIWTQGETESNSCWFPTIDSPNERCTQEISITVDKQYKTLSNGLLVQSTENKDGTRTDYWIMNIPHAPYLFMMAIGDYAVVKDTWKYKNNPPIELSYWVEKEYEPYAKDIFGRTPEMLTFFSDLLKFPYPWQKYAQVVVRDYVSGAMENTTAVIHGEFLQQTRQEMVDGNNDDIIAHELFHHWFGDWVTCESWANLPLNESFATYGEYLWIEYKKGRDEADLHSYHDLNSYLQEASEKQVNMIRFDYDDKEDMFDRHSYQKGGRILHMLRKYVGDEAFFDALHLYLTRHALQSVEMHQLRLAFEEITGEDLNWFFNQWFYASGHPVLEIQKVYNDSAKKVIVKITQLQDLETTPLYKIPMMVDIYWKNQKKRYPITLELQEQYFAFDSPEKPDWVNVDAEKMLLCEKIEDNVPLEELVFQYQNGPLFLDRWEALQQLTDMQNPSVQEIFLKAMNDPFWYLRKYAIEQSEDLTKYRKEELYQKLIPLAQKDPHPEVRTAALETLVRYYDDRPEVKETILLAFNDSSYNVLSLAIVGLYKIEKDLGLAYAYKYENSKNPSILSTLAELYAYEGDPKKHQFYLNTLKTINPYSKYSIINYYGDFLKQQEDTSLLYVGIDILKDLAIKETTWWIRFGSILALQSIKIHFSQIEQKYNETSRLLKNNTSQKKELENKIYACKNISNKIKTALNEIRKNETHQLIKAVIDANINPELIEIENNE